MEYLQRLITDFTLPNKWGLLSTPVRGSKTNISKWKNKFLISHQNTVNQNFWPIIKIHVNQNLWPIILTADRHLKLNKKNLNYASLYNINPFDAEN